MYFMEPGPPGVAEVEVSDEKASRGTDAAARQSSISYVFRADIISHIFIKGCE